MSNILTCTILAVLYSDQNLVYCDHLSGVGRVIIRSLIYDQNAPCMSLAHHPPAIVSAIYSDAFKLFLLHS